MTGISALWLPILLSGIVVFIASSVIHMALPWHKSDYGKVPKEDAVADALRPFALPPGDYMMPRAESMQDFKSEAFLSKMDRGPILMMTVFPTGRPKMGAQLASWFVYTLFVGLFAAYVSGRALPPGTHYLHVFRFAGVTAFLAYAGALAQFSIWYRRSWTTTIKAMIDGLLYALLTAGIFGWLWPR